MEAYLKKWYDSMKKDGKLLGVRCKKCGNIEFPPVPVCNKCSAMEEMEWIEMSGKAKILSISYDPFGIPPFRTEPCTTVWAQMEEGPTIMSWTDDEWLDDEDPEELQDKLPLDATVEIRELEENICFPVFHLEKPEEK